MPYLLSFGLLLLFYLLVVAEFFVPSGGILAVAAALTAVSAVIVGYTHSVATGTTVLVTLLLTTPVLFTSLVRIWPRTRLGQMMLNRKPGQIDTSGLTLVTAAGTPLSSLVGRRGIADSHLLPSGRVCVDDEKLDVVSVGGPIDCGRPIVIVEVVGTRIRVRPLSDAEQGVAGQSTDDPVAAVADGSADQPRPLDRSFDLDQIGG